jgi:hypothetical protein
MHKIITRIKSRFKKLKTKLKSPIVTSTKLENANCIQILNPFGDTSASNIRRGYKSFHKKINKIYKKDQNAKIMVWSWIFLKYPKLLEKYNVQYNRTQLDRYYQKLNKMGVVKVLSGNCISPPKGLLKNGKTKYLDSDYPEFFINLSNPKTIAKLRELKIITEK